MGRTSSIAAGLWVAVAAAACSQPRVGATASAAPRIEITGASVDGARHVVVSFSVTRGGEGVPGPAARAMAPSWTLAGLATEPVSQLPAWRSYLLVGDELLQQLPVAGPGTPPELVAKQSRQPWFEDGGTVQELSVGTFRYTFATALPEGFDPAETLRVGVWLREVVPGTPDTSSTFDFVPAGGAPRSRELVLDQNCNHCHGLRQGHNRSRTGWKLCVTCHTYQHADAETVDPAAMAGATPATNPNPLEFGRLIHRVHRGRQLPTLYLSSSTAPAPALPPPAPAVALPLPFAANRNKSLLGQKFSVVDDQNGAGEMIFGQVISRTDNNQPARNQPTGLVYLPAGQDYRNCDVCHAGAAQQGEVVTTIARRTCQGCHPDLWYGDGPTDPVHLAHPGGPQADDTRCAGCHVDPGAIVPHSEAHQAPFKSPYYNTLSVKLVAVSGMVAGGFPTVTFSARDLNGPLTPSLTAPVPLADAGRSGRASPVPRALASVSFTLIGPSTEYLRTSPTVSDSTSATSSPPRLAVEDPVVKGQYSYTFTKALPATASGTWTVVITASRSVKTAVYDNTGKFTWPYTGETLAETTDNDVQYVDLAAGVWPGGTPVPRRRVVDTAKCNVCHLRLQMHGSRNQVQYCVTCHTADFTDFGSRPKRADKSGMVNLSTVTTSATTGLPVAATYDGIEERSVHLKVMQHRIHTGYRTGSASLGLAKPFVIVFGSPYFFDDVTMPNMIRNCTLCHVGNAFEIENIDSRQAYTVANETPNLQHQGTPAAPAPSTHSPNEPHTPPITAACMGCHDTQAALTHSRQFTTLDNVEQCLPCHGRDGVSPVAAVHGVSLP
ncbi:multiheme c-type cytochrome [Anaeromyxobacter diazotrophicus]|uniref:Outer membrane cytochrome MtrC/MtrF-like domain-containing protein n=1 Tax=Anaeromyxobacter diazotrophicus TaxID=2590199 RepID=A0A7I9VKG1_9BACT|nr:hypothetical protein [Anaeromyxobacter diazotrophicus]GEJ56497.1 hypothetical protein AMYX_12380 [Anaeromyxobacter diazotrophicus]